MKRRPLGVLVMLCLSVGLPVVGAGFALFVGLFTRGTAAVAFSMLTLSGLPDDPVLAQVTLFGMVSTLFITGSGPVAVDNRLRESTVGDRSRAETNGETTSASATNSRV